MRLISAFIFLLLLAIPAVAEEITFFEKETDKFWSVLGGAETNTGQATCFGRAQKKDGSYIQIHRSLVDGEVWVIAHHSDWEIKTDSKDVLRWNFYRNGSRDSLIDGANFDFQVKNKNTVLILGIASKRFTEVIWNTRFFTLIMPGDLENLNMSFEVKGNTMLDALAECVRLNEKKYKDFAPALQKVPDSVRDRI